MKKTPFQQQEKKLDPLISLRTSQDLCPVTGLTVEVGPVHIATPGAGPEATPTLPGATVEVEAGVDTVEDTLVLEVAPTEVIVVAQTVGAVLEVGIEVATDQGLNLTIVILVAAAVVAGEEGIGEARALIAGPGHIAPTVAVRPDGEVIAEAVDTAEFNLKEAFLSSFICFFERMSQFKFCEVCNLMYTVSSCNV